MNTQPFQTPKERWESRMSPWWVRLCGWSRRRTLRQQRIVSVSVEGLDHLRSALARNAGVLITPNHSFHYDSYCLAEAVAPLDRPFHVMTAWQVFAMSSRFERWSLQRHGCFSVNREGADLAAFKQAVDVLSQGTHPLVIFPEGDIYHTNDRVTPFRDGAAAIALGSARRADKPIVCIPCALKLWYVGDPRPSLLTLLEKLEQRLHWRPRPDLSLAARVYRLSEGLLALKELEHCGTPQQGALPVRTRQLAELILGRLEQMHSVDRPAGSVPERVKELRRRIIAQIEKPEATAAAATTAGATTAGATTAGATTVDPGWQHQLDELFFVIQLYSYPGDYVAQKGSIERIAETLDKFEEDVLQATYPTIRAERRVVVRFGEPIELPKAKADQPAAEQLTATLHTQVQTLLDALNHSVDQSHA